MSISLQGKTALITGASSGIGEAVAVALAELGANLILVARRLDRLNELADRISTGHSVNVTVIQLDIRDSSTVSSLLSNLPSPVDILVNNAGLALDSLKIQDGITVSWDTMIDTNLKGLLYVTNTLLPVMVDRGIGHVVNIGSIAGHDHYPVGNVYSATKHAVKALTQSMRIDLLGTGVRATEISPGATHTEFSEVRWKDKEKADKYYKSIKPLAPSDVADAVVYAVTRPLHVDVAQMVIYPSIQASCNHAIK
ncbi:SDR family NAD(P)-dependent oxidoreductase [Piscirickettsia litoralis]|uniref:NAD(P)-dependent oxidoreductase n=1 Tax=Piscirickettsia litoralis TaxID=1891921 RepID=A0ABX3A001_9GAMM|nr:SDR family NAD(P)-dependent oxidoreductase [Piscirickettsia litoralis]ODN41031.1 NAD(P)-dependent oxidoreductase [Piscirickettsia litoralis]